MLTDLKDRGIVDVCILYYDGLKGLPEVVDAVWPKINSGTRALLDRITDVLRAAIRSE